MPETTASTTQAPRNGSTRGPAVTSTPLDPAAQPADPAGTTQPSKPVRTRNPGRVQLANDPTVVQTEPAATTQTTPLATDATTAKVTYDFTTVGGKLRYLQDTDIDRTDSKAVAKAVKKTGFNVTDVWELLKLKAGKGKTHKGAVDISNPEVYVTVLESHQAGLIADNARLLADAAKLVERNKALNDAAMALEAKKGFSPNKRKFVSLAVAIVFGIIVLALIGVSSPFAYIVGVAVGFTVYYLVAKKGAWFKKLGNTVFENSDPTPHRVVEPAATKETDSTKATKAKSGAHR